MTTNTFIKDEIKQPNNYSCLACCAAMITGESLQDIYDFVGHNGSAKDVQSEHPEEWEGFSSYDICMYLASKGFWFGNEFDVNNGSTVDPDKPIKAEISLKGVKAIITVKSQRFDNSAHAIYWDGCRIYDPNPDVISEMMKLSDYTLLHIGIVDKFPYIELVRWRGRH